MNEQPTERKVTLKSTPAEVAEIIGIPLEHWPGNCYGIACEIARHADFPCKTRYGHYLGKVDPASIFLHTSPFQRHGWLELPLGRVYDPTRYVFQASEPYIFIGDNGGEYDAGGNQFRAALDDIQPFPAAGPEETRLPFRQHLTDSAKAYLSELMGNDEEPTANQLFRLANMSLTALYDNAESIYNALIAVKKAAYIPMDNRELILGPVC